MTDVAASLEQARRRLLDLSPRNRLLNTPRHGARAAIIEIVDERTDQLFAQLVEAGKAMGFRPRPDDDAVGDEPFAGLAPPEEEPPKEPPSEELDGDGVAARHRDAWLQTGLGADRLQSRLLKLHYDARSFEQERGVNALYLALGFLEWYETDKADQPRYAPLLLVPVTLTRASALERFRVRFDDAEVATNLSLYEKLKREFGLELPPLEDAEGIDPSAYLEQVAAVAAGQPRFAVHANDAVLGLFSFTKLLMYRDLDPANWPSGDGPAEQALVQALLGDGLPQPPGGDRFEPADRPGGLDRLIETRDTVHVLDADSSQTIAIEQVRRGGHLLVQGPPGTGKSQTIANLIASAVRSGRTVLFVAEKMAALEVVKRRLETCDLGDVCLELHSRQANKRAVLADLKHSWELGRPKLEDLDQLVARLEEARDRLNRHAESLHATVGRAGVTVHQAMGHLVRLARRGVTRAEVQLPGSLHWTEADRQARRELVVGLSERVATMGRPADHPWRGVGVGALLPADLALIEEHGRKLRTALTVLRQAVRHLERQLEIDDLVETPREIARLVDSCAHLATIPPAVDHEALNHEVWRTEQDPIRALLGVGRGLVRAEAAVEGLVVGAAWSIPLAITRRDLAAHGRSWLRWLSSAYRQALGTLRGILNGPPPRSLAARLAILDAVITGQEARRAIVSENGLGEQAFGGSWRGERSDWARLEVALEWRVAISERDLLPNLPTCAARVADVGAVVDLGEQTRKLLAAVTGQCRELFALLQLDTTEAFGESRLESVPLAQLVAWVESCASRPTAINEWIAYHNQMRRGIELGLSSLTMRLYDGRLEPGQALDAFDVAYFEPLMREAYEAWPELATFDGAEHDQVVATFRELDQARIELARAEVALAHHQGLPSGVADVGALNLLRREFEKKRRHLPLRRLLAEAGSAIQAIKPVFMMSPLSVAEFLEPGGLRFDLMVVDEASQVEPVDALGAIARANQLVVVGDDRQLPPTSFFRAVAEDDDDEDSAGDLESILGLCAAQGMPKRLLSWHYRSRHPSLIAVSNREFYGDRLHIVPSPRPDDPELGITFRHLPDGRFERGGAGINRLEARAVAEAVIDHARIRPKASLGVGCFSIRQRDAILHELELRWRAAPDVREFFDPTHPEPFFVKNLETIQGDERDAIMISVGYAPDAGGHLSMNFGPLNRDGGERRLNVLITRARRRLVVFSAITADDIDTERGRGRGVAALKTFLHYARTGTLGVAEATERGFDSPFEEDVAEALAGLGHRVDSQIGVAGFFVDLAVRDPERPGRYLLGIECDGAAYHSAAWARDRDRLRQQVLEDQGWIIHRIWGTDWYRDPAGQLGAIAAAIEAAGARWRERDRTDREAGALAGGGAPGMVIARVADGASSADAAASPAYVEAEFSLAGDPEPHQLAADQLEDALCRIVAIEGPVHRDEIARRLTRLCGYERTGRRIVEAVDQGLAHATRRGRLGADGQFFVVPGPIEPYVRDRSQVRSATLRRPEMLPPAEIRAAALEIARVAYGVAPNDMVTQIGRRLGFRAVSTQLREVVQAEIEQLVADGRLILNPARLLEVAATLETPRQPAA